MAQEKEEAERTAKRIKLEMIENMCENSLTEDKKTQLLDIVETWVCEIKHACEEEEMRANQEKAGAWDDVKGGELRVKDVMGARDEEIKYMQSRGIWKLVKKKGKLGQDWQSAHQRQMGGYK